MPTPSVPTPSPFVTLTPTVAPHPRQRGINVATIRVGLVGCGAFARFSMAHYRQLPDVTVTAVADIDPGAAKRAATELGAAPQDPDAILSSPDVDLIYIATPPAMHHRHASQALLAGKHVLVEKPLATTLADAEELEALAARQELVCVANLVERYNPLAHVIQRLIDSRVLGNLVHGLFINEAADEGLGRGHWFWDRAVSGGIFVEHGVHFFDLVASWLGAGTVLSAARSVRTIGEGEPVEEQVVCTCRYAAMPCIGTGGDGEVRADGIRQGAGCHPHSGVLFHFEHGFHQPSRMDRQELRLVFERGEVRLFDWVPTHGELRALLDDDAVEVLAEMLPGSVVRPVQRFAGEDRRMRGRFQLFEATALVEITFTLGIDKLELYGQVVRDLAADQIASIRDPDHLRRLTEADSVAAVAMACEADQLARCSPIGPSPTP